MAPPHRPHAHHSHIYDVISVFPLLSRGNMAHKDVRLAMAALGKSKHYRWRDIAARHWMSSAKTCGIASAAAKAALKQLADRVPAAIDEVADQLPKRFPTQLADSIFAGLREQGVRLHKLRT